MAYVIPPELGPLRLALVQRVPELEWRPRRDGDGLEHRHGDLCVHVRGDLHAATLEVVFWLGLHSESFTLTLDELRSVLGKRLPNLIRLEPVAFKPAHAEAWRRFREAGLLWWVNRGLHLFGWAIVLAFDEDSGEVVAAYPERVIYRGFSEASEQRGFEKLTYYLKREAPHLAMDLEEDA